MPAPSEPARKKLIAFTTLVLVSLAFVLAANVMVRRRTSAFTEGAGTPRQAGLARLARNPNACAMTMEPSPDNERPMRHVNAGIVGQADVLVLGQSDADHMSKTFFKDDVRFYNGFVSNSYYVYQYEVFEDLALAYGPPSLVLFDVNSAIILTSGREPEWDTPAKDAVWWGFPPFHLGKPDPPPWYRDLPSLLSLAQTQLSLTWLEHQLPHSAPPPVRGGEIETDNGAQFRCVDVKARSNMYRWLADGSRVYKGEVLGVLAPPQPLHVSLNVGDRHVNPERVARLGYVLGRIKAAGSTIIAYTPPLHPVGVASDQQSSAVRASGAAVAALTESLGIDYCDLALEAERVGCRSTDFADEIHISRHCNALVVKALATGCAPRAGAQLKNLLRPATLE